jgi:hypothetical protein
MNCTERANRAMRHEVVGVARQPLERTISGIHFLARGQQMAAGAGFCGSTNIVSQQGGCKFEVHRLTPHYVLQLALQQAWDTLNL